MTARNSYQRIEISVSWWEVGDWNYLKAWSWLS